MGRAFKGFRDPYALSSRRASGGGPAPSAPFTARFGDSANNASGTGAFDTSLYQMFPPAAGTYGPFTVSSGIITPSGAQTVGTYDVGGYPVEVVAGLKAILNQTEWAANLTAAADRGKTILIREGAAIEWNNTTSGFLRRQDALGTVFLGDGPPVRLNKLDAAYDARKHFTRHFFAAIRNFTVRNCRIVPTVGRGVDFTSASGAGVTTGDITYDECLIVNSRPDPNGDFSAGESSFAGQFGFYCTAVITGLSLFNNVVIGAKRGYRIFATAYFENIGNESWLSYEDAFSLAVSGCPTITGGCIAGVGLARSSDTGNPHGDGMQILPGATPENHVVEASAVFAGNNRGRSYNQSFFLANSTNGYRSHVRDCVVVDDPVYTMTVENTVGSTIENCAWVATPYTTLPNDANGLRFGSAAPVSGLNYLRNTISPTGGTVDGSVTQSGNFNPSGYDATDWDDLYEDWMVGSEQYPSLQTIMAALKTKATGPGAGIGHRVTFAGDKNSDYVIDGGVDAPSLSALTVTVTTAASAAATINTDTPLNPIFWAVVPTGTAVSEARDIKRRRVTGALLYGFTSVKNGDTTIALNLSGALSAGVTYDVVCEQENGWTAVSSVARVTFTAT